jgi:DNA-directed RNA polymerase subunit L
MTDMVQVQPSKLHSIAHESLDELAVRIRAEHEATVAAIKNGVEHAIVAGKLLLEAKAQLKHGRWSPWLGGVI